VRLEAVARVPDTFAQVSAQIKAETPDVMCTTVPQRSRSRDSSREVRVEKGPCPRHVGHGE